MAWAKVGQVNEGGREDDGLTSPLVTDTLGWVALDELLNLLEVVVGKVNGCLSDLLVWICQDQLTLEVVGDTGWGDRLGQGVDASLDEPAEEDGGSASTVLLGNLGDDRVLTERLSVGTTERGVGTWEDVVLLQPSDELVLGALDGELDLVWMLVGQVACNEASTHWQPA